MATYLQTPSHWVLGLQCFQHKLFSTVEKLFMGSQTVHGNSQQKLCAYVLQKTYARIFIAALFIFVVLNQESTQIRISSRADNKLRHSNKNDLQSHTACTDLTNIGNSERSQVSKVFTV